MKKESFENATMEAQTVVAMKDATRRMRIDVAAELAQRKAFVGTDFENQ